MVVLNRIYTRTGDDGTTALGTGERRKKYDLRVAAYGTLDEVNAVIGLARLHTAGDPALDAMLGRIQNDLFDVEADLCLPPRRARARAARGCTVTDAQVDWLEGEIDRLNAELAPLRSFILPGGSAAVGLSASRAHRLPARRAPDGRARRTSRARASRRPALKYVNRLSDFLFVAGRYANDKGAGRRAVGAGPEPVAQAGRDEPHGRCRSTTTIR